MADQSFCHFQFDTEKFITVQVWIDAFVYSMFSLSLAQGGFTTLASYNAFHNNCLK